MYSNSTFLTPSISNSCLYVLNNRLPRLARYLRAVFIVSNFLEDLINLNIVSVVSAFHAPSPCVHSESALTFECGSFNEQLTFCAFSGDVCRRTGGLRYKSFTDRLSGKRRSKLNLNLLALQSNQAVFLKHDHENYHVC